MTQRMTTAEHRWSIEPQEVERHVQRRGRRHAFTQLEPSSTAVVVVDMVPFFVEANPYAAGIVPAVELLADTARRADAMVVWVTPASPPARPVDLEIHGPEADETYRDSGGSGLAEGLTVDAADLRIEKRLRGALFPGSSDLDAQLRQRRIDTIVVAGTVAEVCGESTVREAHSLGYRAIMVADAVAANDDAARNATLRTVYRSFGDVRTVGEVGALLNS